MKPGEASVEILRIRKKYQSDSVYYVGLVLLPQAESPEVFIWPNGKRLEDRLFKYHRNTVKFHFYDSISYRHFWKPLEPHLKETKTVYFSCDGVFNKVNFNSLQNPVSKKHIIDDYTIRLVSNSRELVEKGTPIKNNTATLFGFVDYNLSSANTTSSTKRTIASRYGFEGEEIPILPATETEVNILTDELKKKNWKTNLYTSHQASETNLKAAKNVELIHIATHGFFMSDVDYLDAPDGENEEVEKFIRNPLFRSGILLAGASAGEEEVGDEDGVLTAYEAMNLALDQTQLVILSACETGLGEIRNGEGVYGLQRSFIVAGAQAVMMSLWQVDDVATQELMTEFYRIWLSGEEKFQAFRKAQLNIKEKYEMPYYWAAFVMIGR
ncbi:MAG: CHAT domain-containing protein [Flammeovirgaceae bacterium]|nr:CHAT domain-containing protein [Flammeovirgaceae bacterium]